MVELSLLMLFISFWVGYACRGWIQPPKPTLLRLHKPPVTELTKLFADVKEAEAKAKELIEAIGVLFMLAAWQSASLRTKKQ